MKGNEPVYDEIFHIGVNIIRSHGNSTGKTTILDAIFFVLGGDIEEWIEEARVCSYILAEVSFCNVIYTLRREIGDSRFPPIYIFEGEYVDAVKDSVNWLKFAHKRSSERESFSQALFRLLGYPEQKLSTYANITIHEILRLVYSDQLTAVNRIFKEQSFDSDETRQTLGDLLLGIDDLDLHGLRLRLRNDEKELTTLIGRIKATEDIFASAGLTPDPLSIQSELDKIGKERAILGLKIEQLENTLPENKAVEETDKITNVRDELKTVKQKLQKERENRDALNLEVEDSKQFIEALKERQTALNQSEVTRESLGELKFEFCPSCLSTIVPNNDDNNCHLCKNDKKHGKEVSGFLRMQFELNYQIKESEQLLEIRKNEIKTLEDEISDLDRKRRILQERFNSFVNTANPVTAEIRDDLKQMGMLAQKIEDVNQKRHLVSLLTSMYGEKANLVKSIAMTGDEIAIMERNRANRVKAVRNRIEELTLEILHKDVPSEETFATATEFDFDFTKNRLLVDGRSKFSASSVCYLKTAFLFSIFLVSIEDDLVLFPRFALHDNIEDKGATPARVQNMHDLMIEYLKDVKQNHQIILTTSVLSEKLEDSKYCVGPAYSYGNKTLKI